jgi:hypothetical protein
MPALTKLTKAQLVNMIARLDGELIAKGRELERLRLELSIARASAPARPARSLPENMAAAKALAMKLGHSVKVQLS